MHDSSYHRRQLIHILHMAYSGELAAGIAYAGHWRSLRNAEQRAAIQKIEQDEWRHRQLVGQMLAELNAKPQLWRECRMFVIGSSVFAACFVIGWFLAMYFAGRLESGNIREYESASLHAKSLGLEKMGRDLDELSDVEAEHELFFRNIIQGHWLLPTMIKIFTWGGSPSLPLNTEQKS